MVTKLYFVLALIFAAPYVLAGNDEPPEEVKSCIELFKPENIMKNCCKTVAKLMDDADRVEDCKKNRKEGNWTCEDTKCILRKYDLMKGEDIDEKKFEAMMQETEKKESDTKPMHERIRNQCMNEKYMKYPPEDMCAPIKFQICTYVNGFVECVSWKEDEECKQLFEHSRKCKTVLDKMFN